MMGGYLSQTGLEKDKQSNGEIVFLQLLGARNTTLESSVNFMTESGVELYPHLRQIKCKTGIQQLIIKLYYR